MLAADPLLGSVNTATDRLRENVPTSPTRSQTRDSEKRRRRTRSQTRDSEKRWPTNTIIDERLREKVATDTITDERLREEVAHEHDHRQKTPRKGKKWRRTRSQASNRAAVAVTAAAKVIARTAVAATDRASTAQPHVCSYSRNHSPRS